MKVNLVTQIFIAFVAAIILGVIFGNSIDVIAPLGDLFLRLIKFIIAPLILATLVVGVSSSGDPKQLGRMGAKTIIYYLLTTALAIIIGLAVAFAFSPGKGLDISAGNTEMAKEAAAQEPPGTIETLLNIVPENPFSALAEANILQIIFFALFIGLAITLVGEKAQPIYRFFDGFAEIMYKITGIIMKFAPIGVLGLVAPVVGEYGLSVLLPLIKVILAVLVACIIHAALVYSSAVKLYGKMSPLTFFKGISPAAIVAFSTASSAGTLPVTIKNAQENLGVSNRISSFVLPLGATINMDGTAIYQGVSVIFIAQFYDLNLSFVQLLTVVLTTVLASIGTAGVPGAGLIMLTMVLTSIGLPLEGIALIAGIDRILDMLRTSVNIVGDASAAVVVAGSEKELRHQN
ncbi:cation:dicarboxylase symporter family transporter [Virgibacillus dakarensis]|uniref:Dicarboxylate:amino acid:cation symporter DAACS family protein n=1 Tax=Lentibacillus populi TaxID=1827502 RepID=A0A9W5X603_9BACI|nr:MULTISPECIES: dicarboxylate/amino acid:cation symporter [Bacillaceae]MBT2216345.1 dicarboxylate/amino acid:cation symporter [Virgibacillus dakarensis]MTW85198.1 cation:dicarboxylase symporter family transporter [Virgibacillus dakarensis]GGB43541.1 dicarboxylate:amino acid:cation symporter DAACS family protein [Lentibacillus populi]